MENFHVDLAEVVAVVTGASRGAGRAVATVLGEAGATVYVTGRSVRGAPSGPGREGTLEETADAVEQRGGTAVPVRCDHTIAEEVESLFERVRREQGRLDVLVNNAWGGYERRADEPEVPFFEAPFWEQPVWRWEAMFEAGVRAHFLASRAAAPLLMEHRDRRPGLIVHTLAWCGVRKLDLCAGQDALIARFAGGTELRTPQHSAGVNQSSETFHVHDTSWHTRPNWST
jgi:NAD(P)-dependent dehydrogenase (short-subunit alcohol dehydrogenase family)